ncbi:MAG: thioredoxin domain-containing protein [Bacteroidota bacterium]
MRLKFTVIFCVLSLFIFAQNQSIQFEKGSFSEILAKAKKENKIIFIDAYTTWCGPCKWMAKNIFTNDKVAAYYNSNFICAKIDMEKGEGVDIAKKYEVHCYPNLLFIDGDGKMVHRSAGASQEIDSYITLGETAKNTTINFASLENEYKVKNNRNSEFLSKYIDAIAMTCLPFDQVVDEYFMSIGNSEEEFFNTRTWKIFFSYMNDYTNSNFKKFLATQHEFEELYGSDSVSMKIKNTFMQSAEKILYSKDFKESTYEEFTKEVEAIQFSGKEVVIFNMKLSLLYKKENTNDIFDFALKNGKYMDEAQMNSISWDIFEKSDKKEHIDSAVKLMSELTKTETGKNWMYLDTYASLLYKSKNKRDAKKAAEDAIELAKKTGVSEDEYQSTVDLLKKINSL